MIQTSYIKLQSAAERLGVDTDTLLVAAVERRIELWGLLADIRQARLQMLDTEGFGPSITVGTRERFFSFVPIHDTGAGSLFRTGECEVHVLSDLQKRDSKLHPDICEKYGKEEVELYWQDDEDRVSPNFRPAVIRRRDVFMKREDVDALCKGVLPEAGTVSNAFAAATIDRTHVSDQLALANQAARRFWANADRNDPSTHPTNADVAAWLIERGKGFKLSRSQADKAASIIRPTWAHNGRKPDV